MCCIVSRIICEHPEINITSFYDAPLMSKFEPIAKKHNLEKVWLFGSRAREDAKPDSDYDFM